MTRSESLEVVWPLHKWHYLTPDLIDMSSTPENDDTDSVHPATSRDLAARALLAGADCTQERIAELLDTSRRTVGRMVDADVLAALQDATVVTETRTLIADSASRGSTAAEREAADAWLTRVLRDERQVEHVQHRRRRRRKVAAGIEVDRGPATCLGSARTRGCAPILTSWRSEAATAYTG